MLTSKELIILSTMLLVLPACGDVKVNPANMKSEKFMVNGEEAAKYYSSFVTKRSRDPGEQVKIQTSTLSIAQTPSPLNVSLEIVLFDDGTYEGIYREQNWFPDQAVKGKWGLKQTNLILGDLGVATGVQINGRKGFLLLMNRNILTPGLKGKSFQFTND